MYAKTGSISAKLLLRLMENAVRLKTMHSRSVAWISFPDSITLSIMHRNPIIFMHPPQCVPLLINDLCYHDNYLYKPEHKNVILNTQYAHFWLLAR
jgi:hypothetical protein